MEVAEQNMSPSALDGLCPENYPGPRGQDGNDSQWTLGSTVYRAGNNQKVYSFPPHIQARGHKDMLEARTADNRKVPRDTISWEALNQKDSRFCCKQGS